MCRCTRRDAVRRTQPGKLRYCVFCSCIRTTSTGQFPTGLLPPEQFPTRTTPNRPTPVSRATPHQDDSPLRQVPTRTLPHQDNLPLRQLPSRTIPHYHDSPPEQMELSRCGFIGGGGGGGGSRPGWELSKWGIVLVESGQIGELSWWGIIRVGAAKIDLLF